MLGRIITPTTGTIPTLTQDFNTQVCTTGTLPLGNWIVFVQVALTNPATNAPLYAWIGNNTIAYASRISECQITTAFNVAYSFSTAVSNSTGPFNLLVQAGTTGVTAVGSIYAIRVG